MIGKCPVFFFPPRQLISLSQNKAADCLCHEINIPCRGVRSHFPLPNLFGSTRARRHAAGARVSKNPASFPASFNSLLEAPLASFSMPARAPAERVSRILQLGLCHQWAPGPKPYEAECIFNTEEGISAVCFSSEPVSARCCRAHLLICSYLRFFTY